MTRNEAAAYCHVSVSTFERWVTAGRLPAKLKGTKRWDRRAIDRALDAASGIKESSPSGWDTYRRGKGDARAA